MIDWSHLSHSCDDLGSSTCSSHCDDSAIIIHHHSGAHAGHGSLARRYEVVLGRRNIIGAGDVGGGKVVHLVVHDDAGAGGHELAAPDEVDRGSD